jgi:hypothetical protein
LPNADVYLLAETARHAGNPWHLLASLGVATFAQRLTDKPFTGRRKVGPRLNKLGETLVAAE